MRRMDEKGVSPVIGVILMVAITVILAAVIASFVFGMGSSVKKTYIVSVSATKDANGKVVITYNGGPDDRYLSKLNTSINGGNPDSSCSWSSKPSVGESKTCSGGTAGSTDHVVVVATFTDGTEQVVLDTYV